MRRTVVVLAGLALLAAGCGKSGHESGGKVLVAVDIPVTGSPYIAQTIRHGVDLATSGINSGGGLIVGNRSYQLDVKVYDNHLSARRAVADTRSALDADAVAIVTDGTGLDATWQIAAKEHVPVGIVYDGASGLVDPQSRPNVFRIAPTNHGMAFRYAEYLIPKHLKIAFLTDDTGYGRAGRASLYRAFSENPGSVVAKIQIPSSATDLSPQAVQARRAGATALIVWGAPPAVAEAVVAARSSGWNVRIYAPPSAADPLVRQELASRPQWLDGLTFVSSRLTAEAGVGPFLNFESDYEDMFGVQKVGVKTPDGKQVLQPPEFAMYAFDFTNLLAVAVDNAQTAHGAKVIGSLNQVSAKGANGDNRGFNEVSHEGVVDDDVYFARFAGMIFSPVKDDPLSKPLPPIVQTP